MIGNSFQIFIEAFATMVATPLFFASVVAIVYPPWIMLEYVAGGGVLLHAWALANGEKGDAAAYFREAAEHDKIGLLLYAHSAALSSCAARTHAEQL